MEKTTIYQRNHYYQQVCYVERNNQTISYTNQWSSTNLESMTVFKHPAKATSHNQNNSSGAKTSLVAASYNQNYTLAANGLPLAAKQKLNNSSAARISAVAASDNSNNTEQDSVKPAKESQKRNPTTCEIYIARYFAGEDIGVNGLERWLSEKKQNFN